MPGEIVTIVGPNGAGKSTLIRAVIGLLAPRAGSVLLRGDEITGTKPHRVAAQGIGYVPQRDNVFPTLRVEENLELGATALARDAGRACPRCSTSSLACASAAASGPGRSRAENARCSRWRAR